MNVKSSCATSEARWRRDAALRRQTHMNMSNTPFINIETCNGELDAQTTEADAPPRLYHAMRRYPLQLRSPADKRWIPHETPRQLPNQTYPQKPF